ncbi:MAG: LysE family translocator [Aliarcobacter sp.]|nr:LysE family translocator [Aliarcobacter sp.]MBP7225912.1 LysE family translocator [Aliarcobacter sp.]
MLPLETLIAFFTTSVLLAIIPGPDNIFVLTQSIFQGKKSGLIIMLGLCTGLIFHTLAVILGVAVIFQTSIFAFTILKIIGAMYLLYLAWQIFKAGNQKIDTKNNNANIDYKKLYYRGIIMNITNPKVSIFFLAFLPQFTNPNLGSIPLQMLLLGILFLIAALLVFSLIALYSAKLGKIINKSDKSQKILNKLVSLVFVALAIKLISTKQ